MGAIERVGRQRIQRSANDAVYGTGLDGNGYVNSAITLTSDMYYNNLEVTSSGIIYTNGFKVFVKETLTLNGYIGIGSVTSNTVGESGSNISDGTIAGQSTSRYHIDLVARVEVEQVLGYLLFHLIFIRI